MEQEGLEQVTGARADQKQAKRRFRWVNLYSISLTIFILIIPLGYVFSNFDRIIYSIKPYSVLDFEKLETKKPEGTICKVEGDLNLVVSQGIIWKDDTISIYEDLSFKNLVKTIKMPGVIEEVTCDVSNLHFDYFDFSSFGINIEVPNLFQEPSEASALIMSVVYSNKGKKKNESMSIPFYRFAHFRFMNDPNRNNEELSTKITVAQAIQDKYRKEKKLEPKTVTVDENPKNPFEYLTRTDTLLPVYKDYDNLEIHNYKLTNLADGHCLYEPVKGVQFLLDKPVLDVWATPFENKDGSWLFEDSNIVIAILVSPNSPTVIFKLTKSEQYGLNILKTKNIDEPIKDFRPVIEQGKPVFYFFGEHSIFRWENTATDLTNLKPEVLLLQKDVVNKTD